MTDTDWRTATLACVRALIAQADPDAVEEVKWRKPSNPAGVPCWSHAGLLCTGETYKDKVKLTFAQGAALERPSAGERLRSNGTQREEPSSAGRRPAHAGRSTPRIDSVAELRADPTLLFNASLDAGTRRAIDLREGDSLDEAAFTALIRAAAAHNLARAAERS